MILKKSISITDFCARHPEHLHCSTDAQYTALANDIYELLKEPLSHFEDVQIRNASISLALFFEDIHSGTHQFEVFTNIYQEMYGKYVPFHPSNNANDVDADVDAMCFVLWYCCVAEREEGILNPQNEGIRQSAIDLWALWNRQKNNIKPNEDLVDYLFCEETQTDALRVKQVLIWLHSQSFLGRWHGNPSVKHDTTGVKKLLGNAAASQHILNYGIQSVAIFQHQSWPLSLPISRIYAEMIRCEMQDHNDELAAIIEKMQGTRFGLYWVESCNSTYVEFKDFRNEIRRARIDSYTGNIAKETKHKKLLLGSLFEYNGEWYSNGVSSFIQATKEKFEKYQEEEQSTYHYMHDFVGQYDAFIERHGGNRLFFFAKGKDYLKFLHEELGLDHEPGVVLSDVVQAKDVLAYFEDNGQITFSDFGDCVKDISNPCYSQNAAFERGMGLLARNNACSPGALMYMIEHDMLPDLALNDIRGKEYGRMLVQDNIDFLARCLRRDITTIQVARKRSEAVEVGIDDDGFMCQDDGKLSFADFIKLIASEKDYRSSANKEWRMVRTNMKTTVLRDVNKKQDFFVSTRDIYDIYLELDPSEIQIKTVAPFVGKENASAVSALLYCLVGRGRAMHFFRRFVREML